MNSIVNFIIILNVIFIISCLEVKLHLEHNESIENHTIINEENITNSLFKAENLFFSKCNCDYNKNIFYVSPKTNYVNFTINITESDNNNSKDNNIDIKNTNLYINTKEIDVYYTKNGNITINKKNMKEKIYKFQIHTICKNNNQKDLIDLKKNEKNNGKYRIEPYTKNNHPEYNDNQQFGVLNFTFNYYETLYHFSLVKICSYDNEIWKEIFSCICVMMIAFIYIYLSTYMNINFKIFKEMQKNVDVKWYHILFGVFSASGMLIIIYLYKKFINILLNGLIGIQSWFCSFYTILFFVTEASNKIFSKIKHKQLNKKKLIFDMNIYEVISFIISGIIISIYFITKHWILNNLICFGLCFTFLSLLILKSFNLCFLGLFAYFIYDTFWVFYSEKVFEHNLMDFAASSMRIPVKIEFPVLFSNIPINGCMLLGLGDIILPGIVIKYCRRFDIIKKKNENEKKSPSFDCEEKKGFFSSVISSFYGYNIFLYVISVSVAIIMMFGFDHSQPVLFYISPIFIVGLLGKSFLNKCFYDFWKGLKIKKKSVKKNLKAKKVDNKNENIDDSFNSKNKGEDKEDKNKEDKKEKEMEEIEEDEEEEIEFEEEEEGKEIEGEKKEKKVLEEKEKKENSGKMKNE